MRVELLVIDPQVDFCDPNKGALYVGGAEKDIERLARMVRRVAPKLSDIHVTLDSHHYVDIAHPIFWSDSNGVHPNPFTIITAADVENGRWTTTQPGMYRRALEYAKSLETGGRYALCIWPYHCLIGSPGHAVMPELFSALQEWEQRFAVVDYVTKGSNIYTEHYSAIQAEVPDPSDPSTQINTALIQTLMQADLIAIAGEASSHCVLNTVMDIVKAFGDDSLVKKLVFIQDCSSAVTGFEGQAKSFLEEMRRRGMRFETADDFLA